MAHEIDLPRFVGRSMPSKYLPTLITWTNEPHARAAEDAWRVTHHASAVLEPRFAGQGQGFFHDDEGEELQRLARGRNVLEIGIWKARSTVAMAATARHIVAVDHFRGDAFAGHANTCHSAWTNLCETGSRDRVTMIAGGFNVLRELAVDLRRFGLIHYDADHTYESTVSALQLLSAGAARQATWAIHDYDDNPNHAGVKRAVNEFADRTGMRLRTVRRLALIEPSPPCLGGS